ncbi:tyrosine-type recombinase/integrase [Methylophaga sp.]|uniref:tyrosine-type recombinase/integrase n=1 Tax=Methylophaga sp. TaxID=2024840 RepID=UPI003F722EE9
MLEKTRLEYQSLANHFLENHFIDSTPTLKTVSKKLIEVAAQYRPAYWRRIKTALALHIEAKGKYEAAAKIRNLINPTTAKSPELKKIKQRRVKSVSHEEHQKLITHLKSVEDIECLAAVMTVYITGCRPAEITSISLIGNQSIKIIGAKKIDGIRGCDRTIRLSHHNYKILELLLEHIQHDISGKTSDISRIQRRLQRHVKKLWPSRKHHLSLYSYRHQFGSNLKSAEIDKTDMAEMMGHRSINSIQVYGDRRTSQSQVLPTLMPLSSNTHTYKK